MTSEKFEQFVKESPVAPVSFIIVRHPFRRILSAYRDKFEVMNEYYHDLYGRDIVNKYREDGIKKFGKDFYEKSKGSPVENDKRDGKNGFRKLKRTI